MGPAEHVGLADLLSICYNMATDGFNNFTALMGHHGHRDCWNFFKTPDLRTVLLCASLICAIKKFIFPFLMLGNLVSLRWDKPKPEATQRQKKHNKKSFENPARLTKLMASIDVYKLIFKAYVRAFFSTAPVFQEKNRKGYGQIYGTSSGTLFSRNVLRQFRDCYSRPICSAPGAEITVMERTTKDNGQTFQFTHEKKKCINLGSFNYFGLAGTVGPWSDAAQKAITHAGVAMCSSRQEIGTTPAHVELEAAIARFLRVEAAVVFGMGFSTNASSLSCLISRGCLAISDEKNHASMITGMRLSGGTVRVFKHNDMISLETVLREAILQGQPGTHRPWKNIFVVVEGIYSMEGTIVNLPAVISLKKKYKTYIYLDEAHSMGTIGPNGRGAVDYFGLDPKDVDVHMGLLSKTFASAGAYMAGSKKMIEYLRAHCSAMCYETALLPAALRHSLAALRVMQGEDGTGLGKQKVKQLAENTRFLRRGLHDMGVIVHGHDDSPLIPVPIIHLSKLSGAVRTLKDMSVAVAAVAFPATPLLESRLRICLSAGHTRQQLEHVLKCMDHVSEKLGFKDSHRTVFDSQSECIKERVAAK